MFDPWGCRCLTKFHRLRGSKLTQHSCAATLVNYFSLFSTVMVLVPLYLFHVGCIIFFKDHFLGQKQPCPMYPKSREQTIQSKVLLSEWIIQAFSKCEHQRYSQINIFADLLLTREQAVVLSLIRLAVGAWQVKANSIPEPGTGLYYRLGRHLKVI